MTAFIAFVRGVNVGGNKMLSSAALKAACESLGFERVKTYLNSGNVVFHVPPASSRRPRSAGWKPAPHESEIERAIRETAAVDARVIVRTAPELRAAIELNPLPAHAESDPSHLIVEFLSDTIDAKGVSLLRAYSGPEAIHIGKREIYVHFPVDMPKSKLNLLLTEKKLGVAVTGRNWNTVNALLRIAEE